MKHICLLFLSLIATGDLVLAQFAIVQDADGYSNLRAEGSTTSLVLARIKAEQAFWVYDEPDSLQKEWVRVAFNDGTNTLEGYLHRSRVRLLATIPSLEKFILSPSFFAFSDRETIVQIKSGPFEPTAHVIGRHADGWVEFIDGKTPKGTDGGLPTSEISWITLIQGEKRIDIPREIFGDLYTLNPAYLQVHKSHEGLLYLSMLNSDGGGAYVAILVFREGRCVFRSVMVPF